MRNEQEIKDKIENTKLVIYLDECAAGNWAGDLFVCGLVIKKENFNQLLDVNDSKKLTEKKRAQLYPKILELALDYELVRITPEEIDSINILQSRMQGFKRAIDILSERTGAKYAIIDGDKKPNNLDIETDFLIKADAILPGVSCASIIAKHSHTVYMTELAKEDPYSKYGFEKHKAYGTKVHMDALKEHGPIPQFHRYSFQPIKNSIK